MIIDGHVHFNNTSIFKTNVQKITFNYLSEQDITKMIEEAKIDKIVLIPTSWLGDSNLTADYSKANEMIHELANKLPNKIIGFSRLNPLNGKGALDVLDKAIKLGLKGLKLHPLMETFPANSNILNPIMERLSEAKLPVLFHTGDPPFCQPALLGDLARRFPKVKIILGHMGQRFSQDAIFVAKLFENIFLETSSARASAIITAVNEVGEDRVIFGSDAPFALIELELRKILLCGFSDRTLEKILGNNLLSIL
jgi:predicted TIM-barrel fold metal-dependent hydrolase